MNKEILNKWEISTIINQFPEIKQIKEERMKEYALHDMISRYTKTLPTTDLTQPGEFITHLLDDIYDVYCGRKDKVSVIEAFRETVMNDCIKNPDHILQSTIYDNNTTFDRNEIIPVYYGEFFSDLKMLNNGINNELKKIGNSYDSSDELICSLIKEPCEWLIVNNCGNDFIKRLYNNEEVSAVIDGIEFVNAILKYKDEIRSSLDEEKNMRSMGWGDFEPITCLNNIVERLDYETIRGLIYVEASEFGKCDFINDCKEVIMKCIEQEEKEQIENEMNMER